MRICQVWGAAVLATVMAVPGLAHAQAPVAAQPSRSDLDLDQMLAQALDRQRAGDLLGAINAYKIVLQSGPNRADVHSNLGAAYISLGDFEQGMAEYREAINLDPGNPLYHFNLGLAYYKSGRHEEALPEFQRVLALAPTDKKAILLAADSELQLGRDADVITLLDPHRQDFPDDVAFAYLLGMAYVRSGKTDQGQVLVDRVFKAGESAEGHLLMGMAYLNKLDFKSALPELARAVELNPKLPSVHTLYARALLGNADQETATRQYSLALQQNPNDFEANLQLGNIRLREQRFDDAMIYLSRASAIRPGEVVVREAMATTYLGQDQPDKARELLEQIVKDAPDYVDAHVQLATAYYRLKRKADGDRERAEVARLTAENQAKQPGAKALDSAPSKPPASSRPQGAAGQ